MPGNEKNIAMSKTDSEEIVALVAEIMKRDATTPAFALMVARALIAKLSTADALSLIKRPPAPTDVDALIG